MEPLTGELEYRMRASLSAGGGQDPVVAAALGDKLQAYVDAYSENSPNPITPNNADLNQRAARQAGRMTPGQFVWASLEAQGDGKVVDGKWYWSAKHTVPYDTMPRLEP